MISLPGSSRAPSEGQKLALSRPDSKILALWAERPGIWNTPRHTPVLYLSHYDAEPTPQRRTLPRCSRPDRPASICTSTLARSPIGVCLAAGRATSDRAHGRFTAWPTWNAGLTRTPSSIRPQNGLRDAAEGEPPTHRLSRRPGQERPSRRLGALVHDNARAGNAGEVKTREH